MGARATAQNDACGVPLPVLAEADEIFQGHQPCLTVVDGRSFLVLNLTPAAARDATTWGVTFLDLQARGVQFQDLASDGGTGIRAGAAAAQLAVPLRPDLFHLLREAGRVGQRLERQAYQALQLAERARRAAQEAQAPQRRRGPRLKVAVPLAEAVTQEAQAITIYDQYVWLLGELRQALEPFSQPDQLMTVTTARQTVETALALLRSLPGEPIQTLAQHLHDHLDALLAPLAWLEQTLAPYRQNLDLATETLILWAWRHRQALALTPGEGFPAHLQATVQAFWLALSFFHRSSSLAESLHSWLRPYLTLHRGTPQWLLPLLQLVWNHHPFTHGSAPATRHSNWRGSAMPPPWRRRSTSCVRYNPQQPGNPRNVTPSPKSSAYHLRSRPACHSPKFLTCPKVSTYLCQQMNHPKTRGGNDSDEAIRRTTDEIASLMVCRAEC